MADDEQWGPIEGPAAEPTEVWPAAPPIVGPALTADVPPPYVSTSQTVRKGSRRVGLLAGAVALVGGVAFAATQLAGGGGASSPEAAVEGMLRSLGDGDVIGVFESLPDGERQAIQDPVEDIADELKRLEIIDGDFSLGDIKGYQLSFDQLEFDVDPLGDGVAAVTVSGVVTGSFDPGEVELGDAVRDNGEALGLDEVEAGSDTSDFDGVTLVAIQDGGGWYFSAFYSIAEVARSFSEAEKPDFGNGIAANGADSPEQAVADMIAAGMDLDLRRAIELTPPKEMRVLHDYGPLFLEEAEQGAAEARENTDLKLTDLVLTSEGDGDTKVVRAESFHLSGTIDGEEGLIDWDGECFHVEGEESGDDQDFCQSDLQDAVDEFGVSGLELDLASFVAVTTVKEGGKWYVSPTRSVFAPYLQLLRAIDREDVEKAIESFEDGAFFDPFGTTDLQDPFAEEDSERFEAVGEAIDPGFYDELQGPTEDLYQPLYTAIVDAGFELDVASCVADSIAYSYPADQIYALIETLYLGEAQPAFFTETVKICQPPS